MTGILSIVGLGPGPTGWIVPEATAAVQSATDLVGYQTYLDRIEAYDKRGPALNAIIVVNPNALTTADELDARFAQSGLVGPLHCIPMIVKDNYDFAGLPTTAGSLSLKGSMPSRDAFQVRKVREARGARAGQVQHGGVRQEPV